MKNLWSKIKEKWNGFKEKHEEIINAISYVAAIMSTYLTILTVWVWITNKLFGGETTE